MVDIWGLGSASLKEDLSWQTLRTSSQHESQPQSPQSLAV
nr:MAG TPA: hypothetical protein [Caudoviricetes sp.]